MKKLYFLFVFIISCTSVSDTDVYKVSNVELTYQNLNGNFVNEDLTDKSTIIIFWADYWGICRQELPVLEANLDVLLIKYDVIALAHSDLDSTNYWVENNLIGKLNIGISTDEIRDEYKVIGQPITIILDTDGDVIFREYGYIPTNDF